MPKVTGTLDPREIDERYGLEPVFEPGTEPSGEVSPFVELQCPYCGEPFTTTVDLSAGSFRYTEDCQVCCQPIELVGEVDGDGRLLSLAVRREG